MTEHSSATARNLRAIERTARALARRYEGFGLLPVDLDEYTNAQLAALLLTHIAEVVVDTAEEG